MPVIEDNVFYTMVVFCATIVTLYGLYIVKERLTAKNQGFGTNALQAIGVVIFLPMIRTLASFTSFSSEVLAALLGTLAGYIFSRGSDKASGD